jgi:hypothetical protein
MCVCAECTLGDPGGQLCMHDALAVWGLLGWHVHYAVCAMGAAVLVVAGSLASSTICGGVEHGVTCQQCVCIDTDNR